MKIRLKEQKAITLVALIITIIVLLILAVVSVGAIQEDGIIRKAQLAAQKHEEVKLEEEIKLAILESALSGKRASSTVEDTIMKLYKAASEFTGDSEMSKTFGLAYLNTNPNQNTFKDGGVNPLKLVTSEGEMIVYELNYSPNGETYVMDKEFTAYQVVGNDLYRSDGKKYEVVKEPELALLSNDKYLYTESIDGSYTAIYYYKGSDEVVDVAKDFQGKNVTCIYGWGFSSVETDANGMPTTQGKEDTTLKEVILPDTIVELGGVGFFYREALEKVRLPKNTTSIPSSYFRFCKSLKSIEIPENVTGIGTLAFAECSSLESIKIPNGVTIIGDSAFIRCTSLKSIDIPSSVTSIHEEAFDYSGLTTININKAEGSISGAPWGARSATINWLRE